MPCPPVAARNASAKSRVREEAMRWSAHTQAFEHMMFAGVGGGKHLAPRWPAIWMAA